jgi:hypothetical protein
MRQFRYRTIWDEHDLTSSQRSSTSEEQLAPRPRFAVVVPCYNEQGAIARTIDELRRILADAGEYELIVVDDGSTDDTPRALREMAARDPSLQVLRHGRNLGYGAALKTGLMHAKADWIVITDADGTYPNDRILDLLRCTEHCDMAVGSRTAPNAKYPLIRKLPKIFLRRYASWVAGRTIPDINSGLRVFPRKVAQRFLHILPEGFSFTTTITLAMLTNHYSVEYVPIDYYPRVGNSKIRPLVDTMRFVRLIACTGMYFSPLRVLLPVTAAIFGMFMLSAGYDALTVGDMTPHTLMLLGLAVNTMFFALLADMVVKKAGEFLQTPYVAGSFRNASTVREAIDSQQHGGEHDSGRSRAA